MAAYRLARVWAPALACLAAPVAAQQDPRGGDPLKGPAVPDRVARTILRSDVRGNFVRADGRPEAAAIRAMDLPEPAFSQARKIIEERAMAIGVLLVDHIDLMKESADAVAAGNREKATRITRDLYDKFDQPGEGMTGSGARRTPLLPALKAILNEPQQAELTRMLDEYWAAWVKWELRSKRNATDTDRAATADRLAFGLFADEVRAAYDRTIKPYRDKLDAINTVVQPTPEQREAIRAIMMDHIREARLSPTAEQRRAVLRRIYEALDEERRVKFFELILSQI